MEEIKKVYLLIYEEYELNEEDEIYEPFVKSIPCVVTDNEQAIRYCREYYNASQIEDCKITTREHKNGRTTCEVREYYKRSNGQQIKAELKIKEMELNPVIENFHHYVWEESARQ